MGGQKWSNMVTHGKKWPRNCRIWSKWPKHGQKWSPNSPEIVKNKSRRTTGFGIVRGDCSGDQPILVAEVAGGFCAARNLRFRAPGCPGQKFSPFNFFSGAQTKICAGQNVCRETGAPARPAPDKNVRRPFFVRAPDKKLVGQHIGRGVPERASANFGPRGIH